MKIRWTKNSVRLRITPPELAQLQSAQMVEEAFCVLGETVWRVRVLPTTNDALTCNAGALTILISSQKIVELADTHNEGVYFSQGETRYYIEKDFPCAHPRAGEAAEIETQTFAAPSGFEARKIS